MQMPLSIRKFSLIIHIISSVGWIGAVAGFLALAITGLTNQDFQVVRASYISMELIAWFVIVPLSLVSLLSGLIQAFGTKWGLFRHYWVLIKFLLTVFAVLILFLQMEQISYIASVAKEGELLNPHLRETQMSLVVHAIGGLLILLVVTTLSVYKPKGMTRYGWRKQNE